MPRILTLAALVATLPSAQTEQAWAQTERADAHLVIVTDVSPSMRWSDEKADDAKAGQRTFMYLAAQEGSVWTGLVLFTHQIEKELPVTALPRDDRLDAIIEQYDPVPFATARTDLAQALAKARVLLDNARQRSAPGRLGAILLLSDGDYDHAQAYLAPNPNSPQRLPNWRSGGPGKEVWAEIQRLRQEGVVLFTVPITPLIHGDIGAPSAAVREEMRQRFESGHALLEQMAVATGGETYVREPGVLDFDDIFNKSVGKWLLRRRVLLPDQNGRRIVRDLHRSVMIIGRGLRGVTLPTGQRIDFPGPDIERDTLPAEPLGTEYQWRCFGDLEIAVFERPDVRSLAELKSRGWSGPWQLHVTNGAAEDVDVVAFTDLRLSWRPALLTRYWPNEEIPLRIGFTSVLLQPGRLPESEWQNMRKSLRCRAELLDRSGQELPEREVDVGLADAGRNEFQVDLRLPGAGQYDLRITVYLKPSSVEPDIRVLRVSQPITIEAVSPVRLIAYRQRGQAERTEIYQSGAQEVGSLKVGDRLILHLQVVPEIKGWRIDRVEPSEVPAELSFDGARDAQAPERGKELRFVAIKPAAGTRARSFPVRVRLVSEPQANLQPAAGSRTIIVFVPAIPVSDTDLYSRAFLLDPPAPPPTLIVGERFAWPFVVRFENVAALQLQGLPNPIRTRFQHTELGVPHIVLAQREAPRRPAQSDRIWDVPFVLLLKPEHLARSGLHTFEVPANELGLPVKGNGSVQVVACPARLTLRPKGGSPPGDLSLHGHEPVAATLEVDPPAELTGAGQLVLKWIERGQTLDAGQITAPLQMTAPNRAETEFLLGKPVADQAVAEASLTLKLKDSTQARPVTLQFQPPYRVNVPRLCAAIELNLKDPATSPRANQPLAVEFEASVRGGDPQARAEASQSLQQALGAGPQNVLKIDFANPSAVVISPQMRLSRPLGDPADGPVTLAGEVPLRIREPGKTQLVFDEQALAELPIDCRPLSFHVAPCPCQLELRQPSVAKTPLLSTANNPVPSQPIRLLYGQETRVEIVASDPQAALPEGLRATLLVDPGAGLVLPAVERSAPPDSGRRLLFRGAFEPESAGHYALTCRIVDASDRVVAEIGPHQLDVQPLVWRFSGQVRPPDVIPENADRLVGDVVVRAITQDPDYARSLRDTLQFGLRLRMTSGNRELTRWIPCKDVNEEDEPGHYRLVWKDLKLQDGDFVLSSPGRLEVDVQACLGDPTGKSQDIATIGEQKSIWTMGIAGRPLQLVVDPNPVVEPGPVSVRKAWDQEVLSQLHLDQTECLAVVKVYKRLKDELQGEGDEGEKKKFDSQWRQSFDLAAGDYGIVLEGELLRNDLPPDVVPGYHISEREDVVCLPKPWPLWLKVLIGLAILGVVLVAGRVVLGRMYRPPCESLGLQVEVKENLELERFSGHKAREEIEAHNRRVGKNGGHEGGRLRRWARVLRWLILPCGTEVYRIRHPDLRGNETQTVYFEFAARGGNLLFRRLETSATPTFEIEAGYLKGLTRGDVPRLAFPLQEARGWHMRPAEPGGTHFDLEFEWRVDGVPHRGRVKITFAETAESGSSASDRRAAKERPREAASSLTSGREGDRSNETG